MTDDTHDKLERELAELPLAELVNLVARVFHTIGPLRLDPVSDDHLAVALLTRDRGEENATAQILPQGSGGTVGEADFANFGECAGCGLVMSSTLKRHKCPACRADVYLS